MIISHIAFALELIALTGGVALWVGAIRMMDAKGAGLGKFFGVVVTILAIFALVCTVWTEIKIWRAYPEMMQMHNMMMKDKMQAQDETDTAKQQNMKPMKPMKPMSKPTSQNTVKDTVKAAASNKSSTTKSKKSAQVNSNNKKSNQNTSSTSEVKV